MDFRSHSPSANFSQSDMAALARILRSLEVSLNAGAPIPSVAHMARSPEAVRLARRLKSARNQRSRMFNEELFGEPAWDMMLALYIANGEGYRLKISDLCEESCSPNTTALRWINQLIDAGLAGKIPNPMDARSVFIQATELLETKMTAYLQELLDHQLKPSEQRR